MTELAGPDATAAILDALSSQALLLDSDGRVLAVNERWTAFARASPGGAAQACAGGTYLGICAVISPDDAEQSLALATGIEGVLGGRQPRFSWQYVREGIDRKQWYKLILTPLRTGGGLLLNIDISQRLATEEQLSMGEYRHHRQILDSVGEGIHGLDARGRIIFSNAASALLLGWEESELLGLYSHGLVHRHQAGDGRYAIEDCPIWQTLRDGRQRRVDDEVFYRKDGSSFPVEYICSPILNDEGVVSGAVVSFRDCGERRAAEAWLRDQEVLLQLASRVGRVGGWILKLPGREAYWSDAMCEMLGVPPGVVPPLSEALKLYRPESAKRLLAAVEYCISDGVPFDLEIELEPAPGRPQVVRARGEAVRDRNDVICQIQGAFQDITEERARRQQLALAEERFRLVTLTVVDAVWDWDLRGNTIWWSGGMQTLFGYPPEEIDPSPEFWASRVHPEDQDRVDGSLRRLFAGTGASWEESYRFRRRDGSYAEVMDRGLVTRDADGRPLRMVGGMSDLTERRQFEEQIRQAQRLESIGQLTGGIAHDFNNLLTVILGNADILEHRLATDPELADVARRIVGTAERGAQLTQRLLAFARRQALQPKIVDINRLIAGMDDLLRRALGENIEIELIRGAGLWQAMIDPVQLESSLLNLCINSRDAMDGGGRITIETANIRIDHDYADQHGDVVAGQYVMVAVSDTGSGIAPPLMTQVFEPFFTTKEKGKGTGLGLSMVYGFMKQSRGHVNIYSESGQGTTVRMYLPRVLGQEAEETVIMRKAGSAGGSETILLVEDNEMVRQFAHDQLASLGYRVIPAASGHEALELLKAHPDVALLFTDVVMPGGMSGRELADAARKLRPGLPVLYTSGYTDNAIVHHGRLDADVELLSKPYRRSDLARRLRELLDR